MESAMFSRRRMLLGCITLGAALALCVGIQALFGWGRAQLNTGAALSADTLRLHIRAASDTIADQTDKLAVRDALLAYLDAHCTASTQPEARAWAAAHLPDLQLAAAGALARRGSFAPVRVQLVEMYFDTTRYPTGVLPAGRYQAVRIDLGAAPYGRNWWCVLYPGLCRSACGGYAAPAENDLVCGQYVLRFKCVETWQRWTASRRDKILIGSR